MNKVLLLSIILLLGLSLFFPKTDPNSIISILFTAVIAGVLNYRLAKQNNEVVQIWVMLSIFGIYAVILHYGYLYLRRKLKLRRTISTTTK